MHIRIVLVLYCLICFLGVQAQQNKSSSEEMPSRNTLVKFLHNLSQKCHRLEQGLTKQTEKYLQRLEKEEGKVYQKLYKKDSIQAKLMRLNKQQTYTALRNRLKEASDTNKINQLKEYIPHFDTIKSSLNFLESKAGVNTYNTPSLGKAKGELQQFESKMQVANEIKRKLKERKQQLNQSLQQYGLGKQLQSLNKEVYYYQQQINEYKALFSNHEKLEQKAISLLKENTLFKDFMRKNSLLAQLFKLPENYGSAQSLAGLQTNASVQQMLNSRFAAGANGQQQVQQSFQQAQNQLTTLKDKMNKLGGNSSNTDMPNFKPNGQKTKRFLQRIEYGFNTQTQKSRYMLPVTTDFALTAGYKLNDKSTIGLGLGYKMGWGKDISHIKISHEGFSIRSYADIQLKGSFWFSGGYEQHYVQAFQSFSELYAIRAWQQSGLIGISKKYKIGKKKHEAQLLWDFLSYQQIPRTEPIKFRVGIKF